MTATANPEPVAVPGAEPRDRLNPDTLARRVERRRSVLAYLGLIAEQVKRDKAAEMVGVPRTTIDRWTRGWQKHGDAGLDDQLQNCGRKPCYVPTDHELAKVRETYIRLDESTPRGRGLGSSIVAAYRLVAKSGDPLITDAFRAVVLKRKHRDVPPSFRRLLQTSAAVLDHMRDGRSTTASHLQTPRNRTLINAAGEELPIRPGSIFEADDGTLNFYAHIPWPFGGDKCSDRFGVKLGRWQLLAVVDVASECCIHFEIVARERGSYRGEDSAALLGNAMTRAGLPELWRLERGSWESRMVRDALDLCRVPVVNAWHSKQKNVVERFFDRLWTPASLIRGHVGRDRDSDKFKRAYSLAQSCMDGRDDPRQHFLDLDAALPEIIRAVEFTNSEPIQSRRGWGQWIPAQRWETGGAGVAETRQREYLDPALRVFFSREQRTWTVRQNLLGGNVDGPLLRFPCWFQTAELWEFEGCKVKCYFDPYADQVTATLVLQDEWRSCKPGTLIARDVPALDLPPQAVLADDWTDDTRARSLAIRKAIAKAVRTEAWSWNGQRSSRAADGLGNLAEREGHGDRPRPSSLVLDQGSGDRPRPSSSSLVLDQGHGDRPRPSSSSLVIDHRSTIPLALPRPRALEPLPTFAD